MRQTARQTDREADRQTDRGRQTDRQRARLGVVNPGFPRSMQLYTVTDGLFPSNMEQQVSSTYGIVFPHCVVRAPLGIRTDHMS